MYHRSNHHSLLSRGRKAGLSTRELNQALASGPAYGADQVPGQADCNGSIWTIDENGHRVCRLIEAQPEVPPEAA